jgi:hypothetical protein
MTSHPQVLSRTLTAEFYRTNAMFFLVVIGFCFGFMRGAEHIALAGFLVSSVWLAMIPVGVWSIYALKVIAYNKREVRFERNWFLYSLPLTNALPAYAATVLGQLGPAIAYGVFLSLFALRQQQFFVLVFIITSLISLVVVTIWQLKHSLTYPQHEKTTSVPVRKLDQLFTKPVAWIFIEGIVRSQPGMVYLTKLISCFVIYGATQLYLFDQYDERLYLMAACAAFSANLALAFQYQKFELVDLVMFRSLPISFIKRTATFIVTMIFLCFPEIAILFTNLPNYLGVISYVYAILFGLSWLVAGYSALYIRSMDFDSFTRIIFFASMAMLLLILFGVPMIIMAVLLLTVGIVILSKKYYSFQP